MDIYDRIEFLLQEKGVSRRSICETIKVPYNTINTMIKRKSTSFDLNTLRGIANFFSVSTDYLLGMPETNMRTIEIVKGIDVYSDDELLKELKRRLASRIGF